MKFSDDLRRIRAGVLEVAYFDLGDANGRPVFLMHGFPYDVHAYEEVASILVRDGRRVIIPNLRGYGETRFLETDTLRSGEQAALGADLIALMDALNIHQAVLAGYDWGGRAACVVAALWPERCSGLVSANGYNVQNIKQALSPESPATEHRCWYQYYFHSERGRAGLAQNRDALCELLWKLWSPSWHFDERTFKQSARAFQNADFVDVVIHSYRHRFGLVPGDPAYADIEQELAKQPAITVPAVTIDGADDGVNPARTKDVHAKHFSGYRTHHVVQNVGHNVPQEAPALFAEAIDKLLRLKA